MPPDADTPDSTTSPLLGTSSSARLQKPILGKAQACHQCRKRNDANRPCSNCRRSHHKMVRVNPHLSKAEPHCTYDEVPGAIWEIESQVSAESLRQMEARVEELEGQLTAGTKKSPHYVLDPQPFSLSLDFLGETANDIPEFPYSNFPSSMITDDWPASLPPKPLFLHLVDLFFNCWPNSRRVIHRPNFLSNLLEPPSSPRFPFIGLLHAICAAAALHSPYVSIAPMPNLRTRPAEDIFQERTRMMDGRTLAFDEEHFLLAKNHSMASARIGAHVMEATQGKLVRTDTRDSNNDSQCCTACIINAWWSFSAGRWFDVWAMSSFAVRLSTAMGLNFSDDKQKSITERMRHKLLLHEPQSYIDVELRRNVFWCAYALQRYDLFVSSWCFDINDEDITQTLPGTLEAFEAGVDDGRERQTILSLDLFTAHSNNLDDFGIYIKCAIMLSRIHVLQYRRLENYDTIEDVRASHEMQAIDAMATAMKSSIIRGRFNPSDQVTSSAISNLFMAHMSPHLATISAHIYLSNWSDPSCDSANKSLGAARAIIRYVTALMSAPWDCSRLDKTACLCWTSAARALLHSLQHAPESLAPVLRAEIRLIRNAFLIAGGRVILFLRQRQTFDLEILEMLGEQDAAKLFQENDTP